MSRKEMKTIEQRARIACLGVTTYGGRGRTEKPTSVTRRTKVLVHLGSDAPPIVCGFGFWKTNFRNGTFSKTLYTHSTFRIEVGEFWLGGAE